MKKLITFGYSFDEKIAELAGDFSEMLPGTQVVLEMVGETFEVDKLDSFLAMHDVIQHRPKGVKLHMHSYSSLSDAQVLLWLAGDTRSIRPDASIYYRKNAMPKNMLMPIHEMAMEDEHSIYLDSLRNNLATIHRHIKRTLPKALRDRRVWLSELNEFGLVQQEHLPVARMMAILAKPKNHSPAAKVGTNPCGKSGKTSKNFDLN